MDVYSGVVYPALYPSVRVYWLEHAVPYTVYGTV